MTTCLLCVIFFVLEVLCDSQYEYVEILASSNACFSSTSFTKIMFNAPQNGTIVGTKFVHNSGGVTCSYNDDQVNWGCIGRGFSVELLHVTNVNEYYGETYYPTHATQNVIILGEQTSCSKGCSYSTYNHTEYSLIDKNIIFIGPTYTVTRNDQFMLEYTEACCNGQTWDNVGTSCVSVYFLYHVPFYEMQYITNHSNSICLDFGSSLDILYEEDLYECLYLCEYELNDCKMINYFYNFKTNNDSRCYIFDSLCDIGTTDKNNSVIAYKGFKEKCINYPNDWTDSIHDTCYQYQSYNWCNNGFILKTEDEFYNLIDFKYGLTAIHVCCECGGGIQEMDNIGFSVDYEWNNNDDILCDMDNRLISRNWDYFILYQFCDKLKTFECGFLIHHLDIIHIGYQYSIYVCNNYSDYNDIFNFIIETNIDTINDKYNLYINSFWFKLDLSSYHSSSINIFTRTYSECLDFISNTFNHNSSINGIHPCYALDSYSSTINPTTNPTEFASNPETATIILVVVLVVLGVAVIGYLIWKQKTKKILQNALETDKKNDSKTEKKQIEGAPGNNMNTYMSSM